MLVIFQSKKYSYLLDKYQYLCSLMHDIEPYFKWKNYYDSSEDKKSPFYGVEYNEFTFTNKVYNYFIHPQWDSFGSSTLYAKALFVDYEDSYAVIELIGEWNDCLNNDIMFLKRDFADMLIDQGVYKFILACDNVLNFHGSDNLYYEEWWDDIKDEGGWITILNTLDHVLDEMEKSKLQYYCNIGDQFSDVNWRKKNPVDALDMVEHIMSSKTKQIQY
jgi:hypothetical protein